MRMAGINITVIRIIGLLLVLYLAVVVVIYFSQRSLLYFPTHSPPPGGLAPWTDGTNVIGYCRETPHPRAIWLMTHGNGGQAADRSYVLDRMSPADSLYVLEYPGYGARPGQPSLASFNQAAADAYDLLRAKNPNTAICVLGESLGSGPACALSQQKNPPAKIVLVVPFDNIPSVAAEHFPFIPARFLVRDAWDNVKSLQGYRGKVDIFGAHGDTIIPVAHARNLAARVPNARFVEIPGYHNNWSQQGEVRIEP